MCVCMSRYQRYYVCARAVVYTYTGGENHYVHMFIIFIFFPSEYRPEVYGFYFMFLYAFDVPWHEVVCDPRRQSCWCRGPAARAPMPLSPTPLLQVLRASTATDHFPPGRDDRTCECVRVRACVCVCGRFYI